MTSITIEIGNAFTSTLAIVGITGLTAYAIGHAKGKSSGIEKAKKWAKHGLFGFEEICNVEEHSENRNKEGDSE